MKEKTNSPTSSVEWPVLKWPIGRRVVIVDAYGKNPTEAVIKHHWNSTHAGADDDRGIRHFVHVDRIKRFVTVAEDEFDDILGNTTDVTQDDFADILG
jgi:hypothetical protein